jgi:hypothetical protein
MNRGGCILREKFGYTPWGECRVGIERRPAPPALEWFSYDMKWCQERPYRKCNSHSVKKDSKRYDTVEGQNTTGGHGIQGGTFARPAKVTTDRNGHH